MYPIRGALLKMEGLLRYSQWADRTVKVTKQPDSQKPNQTFSLPKPGGVGEVPKKEAPSKRALTDPKITAARPDFTPQAPKTKPILTDINGWMTRNEAAGFLRRSLTMIGIYERQGKLHPQYLERADSRGVTHRVAVYDPKEVMQLRQPGVHAEVARDLGMIASQAFELFNQGKTFRDVVIELKEPVELIRQLRESWMDDGNADLTITPSAKEILEKSVGPFTSVAELAERIESLVKRVPAQ